MSERTPIGFRFDRFVCLDDGRYLNKDAYKRIVRCSYCGALVGHPCRVLVGAGAGRLVKCHGNRGACSRAVDRYFRLELEQKVWRALTWTTLRRRLMGKTDAEIAKLVIQPDLSRLAKAAR